MNEVVLGNMLIFASIAGAAYVIGWFRGRDALHDQIKLGKSDWAVPRDAADKRAREEQAVSAAVASLSTGPQGELIDVPVAAGARFRYMGRDLLCVGYTLPAAGFRVPPGTVLLPNPAPALTLWPLMFCQYMRTDGQLIGITFSMPEWLSVKAEMARA